MATYKEILAAVPRRQAENMVAWPGEDRHFYAEQLEINVQAILATNPSQRQARLIADALYMAHQLGHLNRRNS